MIVIGYARVSTPITSWMSKRTPCARGVLIRFALRSAAALKAARSCATSLTSSTGDVLMVTRTDCLVLSIGNLQDISRGQDPWRIPTAAEQPIDMSTAGGECFLGMFAEFGITAHKTTRTRAQSDQHLKRRHELPVGRVPAL